MDQPGFGIKVNFQLTGTHHRLLKTIQVKLNEVGAAKNIALVFGTVPTALYALDKLCLVL